MTHWLITAAAEYPHLVYAATVVLACVEGPILSILFGFLLQLGYFNFWLVFGALMLGDLIGDVVWYEIGRHYGHGFIRRFGKYIGATEDRVQIISNVFHKHRDPILLVSKMTNGFGFALVTLMAAGMVRIPFRRYMAINFAGQFVWTGLLIGTGYFFGNFYGMIDKAFGRVSAIGVVVLGALIVFLVYRFASEKIGDRITGKRERKQLDAERALRERLAALGAPQTFFSIVIPAHNEAKYIGSTLEHIKALDYPHDLYEALVVENGSTDDTTETVRAHVSDVIRLIHSGKGASRAKNLGIASVSSKSQWIVLLDADTHLEPTFLRELDAYLRAHASAPVGAPATGNARVGGLSVGTTAVLPQGKKRLKADLWFAFYNWGHKLTSTSFAIQLMRADLRYAVRFDETIHFAEDLKFIKDLMKHGKFFYLETRAVTTSTRRFDQVGWFKQYFIWLWQAQVLARFENKKTRDYNVVR